jgi:hypothetical protein
VARIGEKTNKCGTVVDKSQEKRHLDGMRRWLPKWILNKVERRGIYSFKNTVKWRAVVNKVMNRRVPHNKEVSAAQERFCSMALVGCTGLNVKLGSMTAVLIQRTEAASLL